MSIQFVNSTSFLTGIEVENFEAHFQAYLESAVIPQWGNSPLPPDTTITLLDEPGVGNQAGVLGEHFVTDGRPTGVVYCKLAEQNGIDWRTVASHEGIELWIDPFNVFTAFLSTQGTSGWNVILEACDACERKADANGMSDFAYKAWFMPGAPGPYSHQGSLTAPLKIGPGGYAPADYVSRANGWQTFSAFLKGKS